MILSILFALFSFFPVSFFFYTLSERLRVTHELRVGKQIKFFDFMLQTWVDALLELKQLSQNRVWVIYLLQFSILFLFDLDVDYLLFVYLAINSFLLIYLSKNQTAVVSRIELDRVQVRYAIAATVSFLCLFACFTSSGTTSLAQIHFNPLEILFIVPFQLAGMILFGEYPFQGMSKKTGWIDSARFYAWSMLTTQLFLGGGFFFFDFHLKAAFLYLACRLCGIYFPRFYHKDLLRVSILYLLPLTGLLWLFAMLTYGVLGAANNV